MVHAIDHCFNHYCHLLNGSSSSSFIISVNKRDQSERESDIRGRAEHGLIISIVVWLAEVLASIPYIAERIID